MAQDPAWPPVEFADEEGNPSGMAEEYLRLIEQRLGITFQRIRGLSWQESYARMKRWDIDMTTSVAETPERAEFRAFTKPCMKVPIVVLTRTDVTFVSSLRDLVGKKTAVVDGFVAGYWLSRDFPDIPLVNTEHKKAEDVLRASEERYRTLFDSAGDAIFILDTEGRILAVNAMACENYGCTQSELLSMTVASIDTPEHGIHAPERIARLMKQGMVQFESEHRRKDSTTILVDVNARKISWNGQPVMISICRDITDRKRAEETQERLQAQLNQAQKMESVGRLAGSVAHDFNNMLGALLGNVDLALELVDPAQPLSACLHEIQKAAERSADLTRQLLAFARKQTVAPKVLDLNETVEGMLKMLRRLIGEDINLR